jgi:hypothetical protein
MKTKIFSALGLFLLCFQLSAFSAPVKAVNEKLVKSFQTAYPDASQVNWREDEEHYFVRFTQASVVSEIEYDHDGNFLGSIRYYSNAGLLPLNVFWKLHKKFADKTIFAVTESSTQTETTYFVKMEDEKSFITVKVSDGGSLTVTEKVEKQKE